MSKRWKMRKGWRWIEEAGYGASPTAKEDVEKEVDDNGDEDDPTRSKGKRRQANAISSHPNPLLPFPLPHLLNFFGLSGFRVLSCFTQLPNAYIIPDPAANSLRATISFLSTHSG